MSEYPPELVDTIAEAMADADDIIYGLLTPEEAAHYLGHAHAALYAITVCRRVIVELPAPDETRPDHRWSDGNVWTQPGRNEVGYYLGSDDEAEVVSPAEAEKLAAALLAAAAVAKRGGAG